MRVQEFFEQILNGKLTQLDIYNHAQSMTDNFQEDKLNLLWNEYLKYINRGSSRSNPGITNIDEYLPEDPFEYNFKQLGILLSEKIDSTKEKDQTEAQSIFNHSSYTILDDKYMTEQGFSPLSVDEKLRYLNLWIKNAKQKRTDLKKDINSAQFYGANNPTEQEIEIYGEDGDLSVYEIKDREHQNNLKSLKHKINRQNEVIEKLESELEYWQSQKNDDSYNKTELNDFRIIQKNLQEHLEKFDDDYNLKRKLLITGQYEAEKQKIRDAINLVTSKIIELNKNDSSEAPKTKKSTEQHKSIKPKVDSNSGINFSVFNKVIYLTDLWHHADESVIDKLLDQSTTDFVEICKQFERELKRNIILAKSESSLRRLIKHYLYEMNNLYRSENKIENLKSYGNAPDSHKGKYRSYIFKKAGDDEFREADEFQNYILAKDEFLSIIFESLRNNIYRTGISISELEEEIVNAPFFIDDELILEFNIAKEIEDSLSNKKTLHQQKHISWLKTDDTLKQFIEALLDQNLIEQREPLDIINKHFEPVREQNNKTEPIIWLSNQNLLVYLFRNLYKNYLINPEGKEWQMVSEHFIKKSGEQFKVRSLTVEAGKQKDGVLPANGTNTIDQIVDRLITD